MKTSKKLHSARAPILIYEGRAKTLLLVCIAPSVCARTFNVFSKFARIHNSCGQKSALQQTLELDAL